MPSCSRPEAHHRIATLRVDGVSFLQSDAMPMPPPVEWALRRYGAMHRDGIEVGPVDVFEVGEELVLAKGRHRVEALRRAGVETVEARIHSGTISDARAFWAGRPPTHGMPKRVYRQWAAALLLGDPEWRRRSDSELGRMIGVDHKTISKARRSILGNTPTHERVVTRGGQVYRMRTGSIGRSRVEVALKRELYLPEVVAERIDIPRIEPGWFYIPPEPRSTTAFTPLKWFGGKGRLAGFIYPHLGRHRRYVEPFFGGGSMLFGKHRSSVEAVNDVYGGLSTFWRVLRDRPGELISLIRSTPYGPEAFEAAHPFDDPTLDELERARRFIVRNRMSFDGKGEHFATSSRLRGKSDGDPRPENENTWRTLMPKLEGYAARLQGVEIRNETAVDFIRRHDDPDACIYADPPYLAETRVAPRVYRHEMTEADHRELLEVLLGCRGRVVLSGYRSTLYDETLDGWRRVDITTKVNGGDRETKAERVECLWVNRPEDAAEDILPLFAGPCRTGTTFPVAS